MIKNIIRPILALTVALGMTGCDKSEIYLGGADTDGLLSPNGNVVYLTDGHGDSNVATTDIKGTGTVDLYLRSSKSVSGTVTGALTYDKAVLEAYNDGTDSPVTAFPADLVSFSNNGNFTITEGSLSSEALKVTLSAGSGLETGKTYAVPLRVDVSNALMAEDSHSYIILVRDITGFPGAEKYWNGKPGMKIVGVLEVNDVNPLNVMGFTLKESGKQFFDIVVLFSANINFNSRTGRVYVSRNENVQALLDQREKYLKPLQDRGIKVVLGILGNHDISGISTLGPELAKDFAQDVKNVCDAYGLDGVFLDDEYTEYNAAAAAAAPGFCAPSTEAASRCAYEIRKAQPSRLLLSYRYEKLFSAVSVDGMQPGQIFDYVLNDYWVTSDPTATYPGLRQNQAGTGSWNCSDWSQCIPSNDSWTERFSLTGMRDAGYGALMIFNWTCNPDFWLTKYTIKDMGETAKAFWGAELEYDGSWYPKDF